MITVAKVVQHRPSSPSDDLLPLCVIRRRRATHIVAESSLDAMLYILARDSRITLRSLIPSGFTDAASRKSL